MSKIVYRFDKKRFLPEREKVCRWLRANGLDPNHIPVDAEVTIEGDHMLIDEYLTRNGRHYQVDGEPAMHVRRVKLAEPLPNFRSLSRASDG